MAKRKSSKRADKRRDILAQQRALFKAKFGREPGDNDPVFFDPDSDVPKPYPEEKLRAEMLDAMKKAGIPAELIYAYEKTGFFPAKEGYANMRSEDQEEWDAAIDEYFQLEAKGKKSPS